MTYSLNTLKDGTSAPVEITGWRRFIQEIALIAAFVALAFSLISLLS